MGTRNLTAAVVDGVYKIAQYGQWDGYPSGQGARALEFCREHLGTPDGIALFKRKLEQTRFVSDADHHAMYASIGVTGEWMTMDQAAAFKKTWPQLDRDMGASVLAFVRDATGEVLLQNSLDFASDSLMCEWAYVIDLDKGQLEVYRGFNEKPVPAGERFAEFPKERPGSSYYPIRHVRTWPLTDLPTQDDFEAALEPREDAEGAA